MPCTGRAAVKIKDCKGVPTLDQTTKLSSNVGMKVGQRVMRWRRACVYVCMHLHFGPPLFRSIFDAHIRNHTKFHPGRSDARVLCCCVRVHRAGRGCWTWLASSIPMNGDNCVAQAYNATVRSVGTVYLDDGVRLGIPRQ